MLGRPSAFISLLFTWRLYGSDVPVCGRRRRNGAITRVLRRKQGLERHFLVFCLGMGRALFPIESTVEVEEVDWRGDVLLSKNERQNESELY